MINGKSDKKSLGLGFASDGKKTVITSYKDMGTIELVIPPILNGTPVTTIGYGAFHNCETLRVVVLPDTVTHVESGAFRGCTNIEKVVIGNGLLNIAAHAFTGCRNLNSVRIPSTVRHIDLNAFSECKNFYNLWIYDMQKKEHRHFVLACQNPNRFFGFLQAAITYFDNYSMRKYDEGFSIVQERDDIYRVSIYRLNDPLQLSDYMRQVYELNVKSAIPRLIYADDVASLTQAGNVNCIEDDKLEYYIDLASQKSGNCIAYLLEYKKQRVGIHHEKIDFSL